MVYWLVELVAKVRNTLAILYYFPAWLSVVMALKSRKKRHKKSCPLGAAFYYLFLTIEEFWFSFPDGKCLHQLLCLISLDQLLSCLVFSQLHYNCLHLFQDIFRSTKGSHRNLAQLFFNLWVISERFLRQLQLQVHHY